MIAMQPFLRLVLTDILLVLYTRKNLIKHLHRLAVHPRCQPDIKKPLSLCLLSWSRCRKYCTGLMGHSSVVTVGNSTICFVGKWATHLLTLSP